MLQDALALQSMGHFRMELDAVEVTRRILHGRNRRTFRRCQQLEALRHHHNLVAMAHPHVQQRLAGGREMVCNVFQQGPLGPHFDLGIAEFPLFGTGNTTAQLFSHGLHAVANAQNRNPFVKQAFRRARATQLGHRLGATRENDAFGIELFQFLIGNIKGLNLTIDPNFPNAARDELGVLGTEIENQNAVVVDVVGHEILGAERKNAAHWMSRA